MNNKGTFADKMRELAVESDTRTTLNEREAFVYNRIHEVILTRSERGFQTVSYNLFAERKLTKKSIELIIDKLREEGFEVREQGLMEGLHTPPIIYISWKEEDILDINEEEDIEVIDISDLNF